MSVRTERGDSGGGDGDRPSRPSPTTPNRNSSHGSRECRPPREGPPARQMREKAVDEGATYSTRSGVVAGRERGDWLLLNRWQGKQRGPGWCSTPIKPGCSPATLVADAVGEASPGQDVARGVEGGHAANFRLKTPTRSRQREASSPIRVPESPPRCKSIGESTSQTRGQCSVKPIHRGHGAG